MSDTIDRHQTEVINNLDAWNSKPLLRSIYAQFYRMIDALIDRNIQGKVVELGSGIGQAKQYLDGLVCTDLCANSWLDFTSSAYDIKAASCSISHLILFDVFHHLQYPAAFFAEANRVLTKGGRIILFEPYISIASAPVFGLIHPEPVAWLRPIELSDRPTSAGYYAASGNATRLFFIQNFTPKQFAVFHRSRFSAFAYLLSGGYSWPALYPSSFLPVLNRLDHILSRWPVVFGSRCLIGLRKL